MIRVLYDHQIFRQKYGGISRYHYELLSQLPLIDDMVEVKLTNLISTNHYLNADSKIKKNQFQDLALSVRFKGRDSIIEKFNRFNSNLEIKSNEFDVFHPTYYDPYFVKNLKKPFVITIHDFVHDRFYPHKIDIEQKKILIHKAKKIIAISNTTKKDLLALYPEIDEFKIEVVHHGYNLDNVKKGIIQTQDSENSYILFIGKRYGYKNFSLFLAATAELIKENPALYLYCTGSPFSKQELNEIKALGILDRVIAVQATNNELNNLYENALAFVFPSLYEGFGLPILEAFACNCPMVISDTECFKEIAGNAATYFNPLEKNSIYTAIKSVIYNNSLRDKLRAQGYNRLMQFDIKNTLQNTINVYKNVV